MERGPMRSWMTCVVFVALAACGPSGTHHNDGVDAASECSEGAHQCLGSTYQTCTGGTWQTALDCQTACLQDLGCVDCQPGEQFCKDGDVWQCGPDGTPGGVVMQCTGATTCAGNTCVDACAEAASSKSYIGCEYWAVDLDNAVEVLGGAPDRE